MANPTDLAHNDPMNLRALAREERTDLAAFLETLSPEDWETPSLCEGWRIRDVIAHAISFDEIGLRGHVERFARGRLNPNRINAIGHAEYAGCEPEELIAILRRNLDPSGFPAAFGGMIGFADGLIHHQDIRRPLGRPREIPAERLRPALSVALFAPVLLGVLRVRGLRVEATDLDWSFGRGPVVRGPGEALLLTIAGRPGVVEELEGEGQPLLASRVG